MHADRKTLNWQAICDGRDLLAEADDKCKIAEAKLRERIAQQIQNVILKPETYYTPPKGDH